MLCKGFVQVTRISAHPSSNNPLSTTLPLQIENLPPPVFIRVYVLNSTRFFNKFHALWRGSFSHSDTWPNARAGFYPPLSHTHIVKLSINTHARSNTITRLSVHLSFSFEHTHSMKNLWSSWLLMHFAMPVLPQLLGSLGILLNCLKTVSSLSSFAFIFLLGCRVFVLV